MPVGAVCWEMPHRFINVVPPVPVDICSQFGQSPFPLLCRTVNSSKLGQEARREKLLHMAVQRTPRERSQELAQQRLVLHAMGKNDLIKAVYKSSFHRKASLNSIIQQLIVLLCRSFIVCYEPSGLSNTRNQQW